jgi:uncharacterized protein (TIGR00297 family)
MWLKALMIISIPGGAWLSYKTRKLTGAGAITGALVALSILAGTGFTGIALLAVFFFLGTFATSWKKSEKQSIRNLKSESASRTAGQVLANGGLAAGLGVLACIFPKFSTIALLLIAASLAAATADTLSSELGMVYGRLFFNILTFKRDEKGLDGVISLEGTLIGALGAGLIALVYAIGSAFNIYFLVIVFAGAVGNAADSVLGASLERNRRINNDQVNFLNTLTGALTALLCYLLFRL